MPLRLGAVEYALEIVVTVGLLASQSERAMDQTEPSHGVRTLVQRQS